MTIAMILAIVAMACVIAGAISDIMTFEIPDWLSIAIAVAAVGYAAVTPGFDWIHHLAGVVLVFSVGLFAFSRGWMGGGDIKLLTAISAWTGLHGLMLQLTATAIAGGALAIIVITARKGAAMAGVDQARAPRFFRKDAPLPYAVAIASGTFWWAWHAWPIT